MPTDRTGRIVEALLQSAEDAITAHDWEHALAFVEDVRILDPDNADVPALMQIVERHTEGINAEQGRRFVTVLFADIVDSTHLGERLELEAYAALMRLFEAAGRPVIDRYGGHIHNFFGDGIIAYFGYPTAHGDDARRSVLASLEVLEEVRSIAPRARQLYEADLRVRIGLYSGDVVISDRGSGAWMERSAAFGPVMNRAARLQGVATPGRVVISDSTLDLLGDEFEVRSIGRPTLKGVDDPVSAYEVVGRRADASPVPSRVGTSSTSEGDHFVGRSEPLQRLQIAWEEILAAPDGAMPRGIEIIGEPGIGKSRLIEEFRGRMKPETLTVELQCGSYAGHIPLWPVRELVATYAGLDELDTPDQRSDKLAKVANRASQEAASTVPVLAGLLRVEVGADYPPLELAPLQMREVVLTTLRDLVVGLSGQRPTVFVVEDAHWADELTLDLLRRLVALRGHLMVLMASRRASVLGGAAGEVLPIHLDALPDRQAAFLASALLPSGSSLDVIAEVAERSDGVPLYIDQMARTISSMMDEPSAIPIGLRELLQARLDAVGSAGRTAQIASVVGREFDIGLLESVQNHLGTDERGAATDLESDLRDLESAGLIETRSSIDGFQFRHALVEDKAYDSMLAPFRRQVHGAVAATLVERRASGQIVDPGFVAVHYERAGMATEAVTALLDAARSAVTSGAMEAALSHLQKANELLDQVDATFRPALELGVRLNRGYVVSSSQGYAAAEAIGDYRASLDLCERLADQPWIGAEVIKALFGIWTFYAASGDLDACVEAEELLAGQLDAVEFPGGRPALDACRGVRMFYEGDYRPSRRLLEGAIKAFADDDIDPESWLVPNDPYVAAAAFLMVARFLEGDEAGAFEIRDRAVDRADWLPFPQGPFSIAFLSALELWIHRFRREHEDALRTVDRMLDLGERHGFVDWYLVGRMNQPAVDAMVDLRDEHVEVMEAAIEQWRALGAVVLVNNLLIELASLRLDLGDDVGARRCLAEAFDLASRGQRVGLPDAHVVRARLATGEGDDVAAIAHLRSAFDLAEQQDAPLYSLRAGVAAAELLPPDRSAEFKTAVQVALGRFEGSELPDVVRARECY